VYAIILSLILSPRNLFSRASNTKSKQRSLFTSQSTASPVQFAPLKDQPFAQEYPDTQNFTRVHLGYGVRDDRTDDDDDDSTDALVNNGIPFRPHHLRHVAR
jgi:hypothetical protein